MGFNGEKCDGVFKVKVILYIDTSVYGFGLALKEMGGEGRVLYKFYNKDRSCANLKLSSLVKEGLEENKLSAQDVEAVVVAKGPGSFTGIRVGLSWVEGFCEGSSRKKVGVSSLECLASYLAEKHELESLNLILANTRKTAFLVSVVSGKIDSLSFLAEEADKSKLKEQKNKLFMDKAYEGLDKDLAFEVYDKESFALLCFEALVHTLSKDEVLSLGSSDAIEPLYLRKSSVEEKHS